MAHHSRSIAAAWGLAALGLIPALGRAEPIDFIVQVTAAAQEQPPRIALQWSADKAATNWAVSRKAPDATNWTVLASVSAGASNLTGWTDIAVRVGAVYEYQVARATPAHAAYGYTFSAIRRPAVVERGTVVLVVDATQAAPLSNELARLRRDLAGDGWTVARHDVPPADWQEPGWTTAVARVKALIRAEYRAAPERVRAVFLLGHIAYPYSGNMAPDGHDNHHGAWPADGYYGDVDGEWPDVETGGTNDAPRQRNRPGDGKFDPDRFPSEVELAVGRVDLRDMASYGSETELLRRYLEKDHAFRHRWRAAEPRGLVYDGFGDFGQQAFAQNGWRNFAALYGASNVWKSASLDLDLGTNSAEWAFGCGGSGSIGLDFHGPRRVWFMLWFGSFMGDPDQADVALRSPLAGPEYGLTCSWAGRPHHYYHFLALGETVGECMRRTQNNHRGLYQSVRDMGRGGVHAVLMGDPTLRLRALAPPAGLTGVKDRRRTTLTWSASPDVAVSGYHVYRAASDAGPFVRLNKDEPVAGTTYTDRRPPAGRVVYLVRPAGLVVSASGSYYEVGQGAFAAVDDTPNRVPLAPDQAVDAREDAAQPLTLAASDPDGDAVTVTITSRPEHGTLSGAGRAWVYTPAPDYWGEDRFGYQLSDGKTESAIGTVTLSVQGVNDAPAALAQGVTNVQGARAELVLQGVDPDRDALTFAVTRVPGHGVVTGAAPRLVYVPAADFAGNDEFGFVVSDGVYTSREARVSVRVLGFREPDVPAGPLVSGVVWQAWTGSWPAIPDVQGVTAVTSGVAPRLALEVVGRAENYVARFDGYVSAPTGGVYRFRTVSDDGSRLWVGPELVVDNDGVHGTQERAGFLPLQAGWHALTVWFLQGSGGQSLKVEWQGPGFDWRSLAEELRTVAPAAR